MDWNKVLRRGWLRYFIAIPIVVIAAAVRAGLVGGLGRGIPYVTFYPAVMLAALYGGLASGLTATALSAFLCFYWIQQGIMSLSESLAMAVFVTSSVMISVVVETMHRAQARETEAKKLVEDSIRALRQSEERFRSALENAPIGMALMSMDGKLTQVNRALSMIVGYEPEELLKLTFEAITYPDDLQKDLSVVKRMEAGEIDLYEIEKRCLRKDGQIVWVQITGSLWRDESGTPVQIIKQVQNISERKELEHHLNYQAHIDYLTGVANRGYFFELAEQELVRAQRYGRTLTVATLDLDHFKTINDTYGHRAGDVVLRELPKICRRVLREVDIVGRIGGEEFAILFPETNAQQAIAVAERLREAIAAANVPIEHGLPLHFTISIGIATVNNSDVNIDILLHRADKALYEAKRGGRNRTCEAVSSP
jgi:diguanylate cyclase (GGDEF)-like protein/PAS domain S-box-containing protein